MEEKITTKTLASALSKARKDNREVYVWDTELKGFGLRASPTGARSWLVQKRRGPRGASKSQRAVIGRYPPTELDQARELATVWIADALGGVGPVERKRKARTEEAATSHTVGDAVRRFLEKQDDTRYWKENKARFENELIPSIRADTKIAGITRAELRKVIEDKAQEHPVAARNLFSLLRPFFKWCEAEEIVATNPMHSLSPPKPPKKRERKLSDDELRAFWLATDQMVGRRDTNSLWRPFYRLLLLTAQRREEVSGMRWTEHHTDGNAAFWTIPGNRTKNRKEHTVHLSPQAQVVLQGIPRTGPLVFTTTGETSISGYSKAKARLDQLMPQGTPEWRIHDLRRTAASGMAKLGFQPHVIERVLNHVSGAQGGLTGVYQQYEYLQERKACIDAWGAYVQSRVSRDNVTRELGNQ